MNKIGSTQGRSRAWLTTTALSGALALAVAAPVGIATAAFVGANDASAQDYTSGAVNATVVGDNGAPIAGAQVSLTNSATGQTTHLTTTASGSARATGLAPGDYVVEVSAPGFSGTNNVATVRASDTAQFTVTLARGGTVREVVVTASRLRQEFTSTTTGVNVDVVKLAEQEPIARNVTAVTLLAPSAVQGVAGFGNVPSIGGGSVAENAYYVNGLNITNPDTYIGGGTVPFDFYKSIEVKTGGYAAEFGRATGGVINAVTKSGTNTPFFAIHENFQGKDFISNGKNPFGEYQRGSKGSVQQFTVEAGGAIIRDHLFAYGLYEAQSIENDFAGTTNGSASRTTARKPFYGAKLDGYITADQHLELTYFTTKQTNNVASYKFSCGGGDAFTCPTPTYGAFQGHESIKTGGDNWVGKYTGKFTDWFTLSAAYGVNKDSNDVAPDDISAYFVRDQTALHGGVTPGVYTTISKNQPYAGHSTDDTERKFYRVDGDLTFDVMGHHHVRFGLDHEDLSMTKLNLLNGAVPMEYLYRSAGLRIIYEHLGGHVSAKDQAYYIQDSWDVTPDFNLELGLRNDGFKQSNIAGQQYLDLHGNWGPRIGFSWDPIGDKTFKVFGNYGRYFIPPAMNLGFRGHDDYFSEYFLAPDGSKTNFTVDPVTGLPAAIGAARTDLGGAGYHSTCPTDISAAPGHPVNGANTCVVFGGNVQDPAYAKVIPGTRATHEDEFILGATWKANDLWTFGISSTYRQLDAVSEDTDFAPYLANYYSAGGAHPDAAKFSFYNNNSAYYIWNPKGNTVTLVDWLDATKTVTLDKNTANLPTFPKPNRTYQDLVMEFHRAWDGKWNLNGSLTLSRSYGNYEGTVKSDAGNGAQADAGSTQDYDYIGLTDYSTGLLPNHRGIQFKSWGAYQVMDGLLFGANLRVTSPMRGSCEGIYAGGADPIAPGYGPSSFYCGGLPSPRGTGWSSDWEYNLDVSARYTVPHEWTRFGKLILRADAFNILNSQAVNQRYSQGDLGPSPTSGADPLYGRPLFYQTPRTIRVGLDWSF